MTQAVNGSSAQTGEFSDVCEMQAERMQMLHAAVDCSTCVAATGKALSPMADRCIRRTTSDDDGAE